MRVLVTGAGGHVGGAVAERLASEGHEVVALLRRTAAETGRARALVADIGDRAAIEQVAQAPPCEAIVHAAAVISADPADTEIARVNGLGTQHVLWLAEHWGSTRFVFTSSIQVVGRPRTAPIDEDHPLDPPTAYHASKLFGERLVTLAAGRGIAASSLRLTSPIGPGMADRRIVSVFVQRALDGVPLEVAGAGSRQQDYVDVRDVADAVALALDREATGVLNVASGRPVSNLDLAQRCVRALGSASEVRTGATPDAEEDVRWEVSVDRAAEVLGFAPRRSLETSLADLADALQRGRATAISRSPRRREFSR